MIPKLRIMSRQTAHTKQRARRPLLGLLAGAILATGALTAPPAVAAEGKPPEIVSTGWGVGGEVTVSAQINPEGLETRYEIKLVCPLCGPAGYSPAVGQLPAVNEARTVTLNLTGIQPGSYRYEVLARNFAGNTSGSGELDVPPTPPGACPNGCSSNKENTAEVPVWSTNLSNSESAQTLKEYEAKQRQLAKEQEEAKAREAARLANEEAELKQAEERQAQEATAREEAEHPACRVPALKGDTLAAARRALRRAHCRLGAVHQPVHHHGALYVSAQGAPAGKRLAHGARVALWCGSKRASHRVKRVALPSGTI
jgi:hypothetical protein